MPQSTEYKLTLASNCRKRGEILEAERVCREVLARGAPSLRAIALLWRTKANIWGCEASARNLSAFLQKHPASLGELCLLVVALRRLGRSSQAIDIADRATVADPSDAPARHLSGLCKLDAGRLSEAEERFSEAIRLNPNVAAFHECLGATFRRQGRFDAALRAFHVAARLAPDSIPILQSICSIYLAMSETEEALQYARRMVELDPSELAGRVFHAQCLLALGQGDAAEREVESAVQQRPEDGHVHAAAASVYQAIGRTDQVFAHAVKSIDFEPRQGLAYLNLVSATTIDETSRDLVTRMAELTSDESLDLHHRCLLDYALGKAHEDLREYEKAIGHFHRANQAASQMKFGGLPFGEREHRDFTHSILSTYSRRLVSSGEGIGSQSESPILVVGMIRSGTTLVEQILSSHPDVAGAGELGFWNRNFCRAIGPDGNLDREAVTELAKEYERLLSSHANGAARIVDKMPGNYMRLGLIHLAFPNARTIHISRDPVDTCLSIYTTPNAARLEWAHDLRNIAVNYRLYRKMMDHWRRVLPVGRMIEIRYEDLVSRPEETIPAMLASCGLTPCEACLAPHMNRRIVNTPSLNQVRQPIYNSSVGRSSRFEPWIQELFALRQPQESASRRRSSSRQR